MAFRDNFYFEGGGFGGGGGWLPSRFNVVAYTLPDYNTQIQQLKSLGALHHCDVEPMVAEVDSFDPLTFDLDDPFSFTIVIDTGTQEALENFAYGGLLSWDEGMKHIRDLERRHNVGIPIERSPFHLMMRAENGDPYPITAEISAIIDVKPNGERFVAWARPDKRNCDLRLGPK